MIRQYLIHHKGKGCIRQLDPAATSSDNWGEILREFAGGGEYAEAISLWPENVTPQGITYDWELAGSAGASFRLHVWAGITAEQVKAAKSWLKSRQDVVYFHTLRLKEATNA